MESVKRLLKGKGQRFTAQKKELLNVLKHKPQTVRELLSLLTLKKITIDKVTIYRILTNFMKIGLVREVFFDDRESRFELIGGGHHHHLVCEDCGGVEDVEFAEEALLREVAKQSKFKIQRHSLEFFGTCAKCQYI